MGPDLSSVGGTRTVEALVESVRSPSQKLAWGLTEATKEFAQEYETVTVVLPVGKEVRGVTLNEDQFTLQMMDSSENIYLLQKDQLRSIQKSRESLMPAYDKTTLSDQDLNDLLAYLVSVAAQ